MKERLEITRNEENFGEMIYDIGLKSLLLRDLIINKENPFQITNFELLILEVLEKRNTMSISELCKVFPSVSGSSISTTVTKLWRDKKLVNKHISPENQRVTLVDLTTKGRKALSVIRTEHLKQYSELKNHLDLDPQEEKTAGKIFAEIDKCLDDMIFKAGKSGKA